MQNTTQQWLHGLPIRAEAIESVLIVVAMLIMRNVLLTTRFRRHPDLNIEDRRHSSILSRNLTLTLVLLGLAMIWAAQIQTLALSMFTVAVTTVVATKELIMCLSGNILRSVTKQYSIDDHIEVDGLRGRVVDIDPLNTLIMWIGPHPLVGRLSGKVLSFPNNLLLSYYVRRGSILGPYMIRMVGIPVPIHLSSDAVIPNPEQMLEPLCAPCVSGVSRYPDTVQVEKLLITPVTQPHVTHVPHDDKVYNIIMRYASPVSERLEVQQAVLDEFLRIQYRLLNPHS